MTLKCLIYLAALVLNITFNSFSNRIACRLCLANIPSAQKQSISYITQIYFQVTAMSMCMASHRRCLFRKIIL